jgi:hypothetical protein
VLVDDPVQIADALTIFLARFPNARRALGLSADASPDAIKRAARRVHLHRRLRYGTDGDG